MGWLAVVIVLLTAIVQNRVLHSFFSNKRCVSEFGSLSMSDVTEPPRSLFPKLPFELLGSRYVYGPDENVNLTNFSTVELVSLP